LIAARRPLIVLAVALVCAGVGVSALRAASPSVATDNAYLKSDSTVVAPRVKGQVVAILVADNEVVEKGQPLVRVDPEEYAARLSSAQGDLALADAQVAAARAAQERMEAEIALAIASVREAGAGIQAADAEVVRSRADRQRYEALAEQGVVARRDADRVKTEAVSAEAAAERTRAALAVSRDQATVAARRRGEATAQLLAAQALRAKAAAALDLARQDADHALIRAPVAGVVADRQVNAGDYVQPGTRMLTLVPSGTLHVIANFKETQTVQMLPGQAAVVKVDALPGVSLKAHVESLAPGSGSEFALLPFEPGAGNFTKVVQRVPVRLVFDADQPDLARLRSGLSAKVAVRLASSPPRARG
jgi:membrane fusion protein (multidrug efflux system)